MKNRRAIEKLSVLGVIVSAMAFWAHYSERASAYCAFGNAFNCDVVNRGIYAELFGVPVALIGIMGYAALFIVARYYARGAGATTILTVLALVGFNFSLYLTYLEAFVLATWCILCIASFAIILLITVLMVNAHLMNINT